MLHINSLPLEIVMHVASFLDAPDLVVCNYVCNDLSLISKDYSLWRKFFVDIKTSLAPVGRLCHTGVVYDDKMYIYGGHITQPSSEYFHTVKQDVQSYDFAKREWKALSDDGQRRTEHTTTVVDGKMYVFGGYSGTGYEHTVMVYDLASDSWSHMETKGDTPAARSAHTAVQYGKSMYVFGGWNGNNCMNDLYELKIDTQTWTKIRYTGEPPCTRCSHGAALYENGANSVMTVFGGYAIEKANDPCKGYLNDLYEFSFATLSWKRSHAWGTPPSARSRFRMVGHQDSIYLFAGWNSTCHFNNLFKYSMKTKQWEEIPTNFAEEGIGQFSLIVHRDVMYVFSGYSPMTGSRSNLFGYPLVPRIHQHQAF